MKTCDENDNLLPLSVSGIHDLINNGMSYIPSNKVNLVDILPTVTAPLMDSPENCFFLPKPSSPAPAFLSQPTIRLNNKKNLTLTQSRPNAQTVFR